MKNGSGGCFSFACLLTVVFVVLKLCKVISWAWVWVFAPLWISASLCLVLLTIYLIFVIWIFK
jgi:hypothetical protein